MCINFITDTIRLLLLLTFSLPAFAQPDTLKTQLERELLVGVHPQPPYMIEGQNGNWDGISIRLWRAVAEELELDYRFIKVAPEATTSLLLAGNADIILLGDVTATAEAKVDFSHVYHTAQLGVASSQTIPVSAIAKAFFGKRFWYIAGILSLLLLIVGALIYFVERRNNKDDFGGDRSVARGVGAGFWWAGVTMTSIGYGDKAPVTFFGRAIALTWMLIAMMLTAVITASLVSTVMDSGNIKKISVPGDLRSMQVGAVEGTAAAQYLQKERIAYQQFTTLDSALKAVKKHDLEAVLHRVPDLRYAINNKSDLSLKVQPVPVDFYYYAFAVPGNSTLREPLNLALLRIINTPLWQQELERFIPEQN